MILKRETLETLNTFLVWKYELAKNADPTKDKPTKVPYCGIEGDPIGTSEKYRSRLTTYKRASVTAQFNKREFDGVGFVFSKVSDKLYICGIDVDGKDPDSEFVKAIIAMFPNAYIERSPSGNGIHIVMLVDISRIPQKDKKLDPKYYSKNPKNGVEAYVGSTEKV